MRRTQRIDQLLVLAGCLGTSLAWGQETATKPKPAPHSAATQESASELGAIRAESKAFVTAFNKHDAKAVAALWTEDGTYIDEEGQRFTGRNTIEQHYARFFATNLQARIRITIDSLRLLSANAAIEDGRAILDPPPPGAPGVSRYTAVHVKVDGQWRTAEVRDSWTESTSTYGHLADLEWLIGTWRAEEYGETTESICRWVANKSFVERSYTVTRADGTTGSGVQLIGWNAQTGQVQSWNFSSDGGHAVGTWTPHEGGWSAEVQGMTGKGTATFAVNRLTRLDDNAYVWQSTRRTIGEVSLPDTDEVVVKRHR